MKSLATIALALALSCAAACGQSLIAPPDVARGLAFNNRIDSFTASNGFRVFVLPDDSVDVVRLELRYTVGASADPIGKAGLAHLIEHLMFQTRLPIGGELRTASSELSRLGLGWNAYTSHESTHYLTTSTPENLGNVFALEMYRLASGCSTWDEETFLREREIVRNEMRQRMASPSGAMSTRLRESLYGPDHPYGRQIGGSDETITSITLEDVCAFVQTHYTPRNAYVLAVGDTTLEDVRALAQNWFPRFPPTPATPSDVGIGEPGGDRRTEVEVAGLDDAYVHVAWPLPPEGTREHRLAMLGIRQVAASANSMASMYDWGSVSGYQIGGEYAPMWVVSGRLRKEKYRDDMVKAIKTGVRRTIESVSTRGKDGNRSRRWLYRREYAKLSVLKRFESLSRRGPMLADAVQFDSDERFVVGRLQELDETQPRELRSLLAELLDMKKARVVDVAMAPGERAVAGGYQYQASAHGDNAWKITVDPAEADRDIELPTGLTAPPSPSSFTLDNGLEVVLWPHGEIPTLRAALVIRAGHGQDPEGKDGLAWAVASVNRGGRAMVSRDATIITQSHLATEAQDTLGQLSKALRIADSGTYMESQARAKREFKREPRMRATRYRRNFGQALFGRDHPYSGGVMTAESVEEIDTDPINDFRDRYYKPANTTLILVGRFEPELIRKHVEYNFAHLGAGSRNQYDLPQPSPRTSLAVVSETNDDLGSLSVEMAWIGGNDVERHADRAVLARVLDAKLSELRERLAVTYGFGASYTNRRGPATWRLSGQVDPARSDEAMVAIREMLDEMRADPNSYRAAFILARRAYTEELLLQNNSPARVLGDFAEAVSLDLPLDSKAVLARQASELRLDDLHSILTTEIVPTQAVLGLYGPSASVARARSVVEVPRAAASKQ